MNMNKNMNIQIIQSLSDHCMLNQHCWLFIVGEDKSTRTWTFCFSLKRVDIFLFWPRKEGGAGYFDNNDFFCGKNFAGLSSDQWLIEEVWWSTGSESVWGEPPPLCACQNNFFVYGGSSNSPILCMWPGSLLKHVYVN